MSYQVRVTWAEVQYTASGAVPVIDRIPLHVGNAVAGGPQGAAVSVDVSIDTLIGNAIANGNKADVHFVASGVKPTITTSALYSGTVGASYASGLHANGTAPITWSLVSGSLPPGLALGTDGALTGTPTTEGSYSFTAKATNLAGEAQALFTLQVSAAAVVPPTINVPYAARPATLDGCWASWSEQQQTNMLRTQMDSGAVKVRRRTTGITRVAQVSVSMAATKYAEFMKWFNVNCQQGVMPTLMCTPQCKEELWRFVNPPAITWVTKDVFTASCEIERLPGW
jgi:hypothetical protein